MPVVLVDLDQEQARVLNLALNRISGSWDQELLSRLLADLKNISAVDLTLTGFSEDELKKHLKGLDARERRERLETFDLDEALKAAQSALVAHTGDVWLLGEHRLLCGDSLDVSQVERLINGTNSQMAITDPPYNVDYGYHGGAPKAGKKRTI